MNCHSASIIAMFLCVANGAFAASGRDILDKYRSLPEEKGYETRFRYLESLGTDEFHDFIKAVVSEPGYDPDGEGASMAMPIFAKHYLSGPAKNASVEKLIAEACDQSLPAEWRFGLLDAAKFDRRDLSSADLKRVCDGLGAQVQDAREKFGFRRVAAMTAVAVLVRAREQLACADQKLTDPLRTRDLDGLRLLKDRGVPKELVEAAVVVVQCEATLLDRLAAVAKESRDVEMQQVAKAFLARINHKATTEPATKPVSETGGGVKRGRK